jgi:hypothetical protein
MLFPLGQVVATPGAIEAMEKVEVDKIILLGRHQGGDWSELEEIDQEENRISIERGWRIFSAYTIKGVRFYVITEADRSSTTILLPEEY